MHYDPALTHWGSDLILNCCLNICLIFVNSGHIMITNFLLNYFAGVDTELRNCHGFTAIMKAAMQGRANCVRALMMSGIVPRYSHLLSESNIISKFACHWVLFQSRGY